MKEINIRIFKNDDDEIQVEVTKTEETLIDEERI